MNTVTASFHKTVRQMTETSQRKKTAVSQTVAELNNSNNASEYFAATRVTSGSRILNLKGSIKGWP